MNSEDINTTEKRWSAFSEPGTKVKALFNTAASGLYGIEYTPLLVSKELSKHNAFLFVCNAYAITRNQRYGVLVKVRQNEAACLHISNIVKIGNPNIVNSYSTFKYINADYEKDVFTQMRQYFTGVHCEPLLVATQTSKGSNLLFVVNAHLTKGGANPYPLFVKAYKPLYGEVRLLDVVDAEDYE